MNSVFEHHDALLIENKKLKEENRLLKKKVKTSDADISNALEAAKQANLSKSKFLTTMSHEIRTPLNAIIGISDIELLNKKATRGAKDAFGKINNSGKLLLGIINDILDLAELESGKMEIMPEKYDTAAMINDITQFNLLKMGEKELDLIVKVPETLPASLCGDELRIRQVLNNMLSNAINFTQQGSVTFEIDFKTRNYGGAIIFRIKDTGQGMSREQLIALHEQNSIFNRVENRTTEGAGMGISLSVKIVEMMDGMIDVESEPGEGTTVTIYLPQSKVEGDTATIGAATAESLKNLKFTGAEKAKLERAYMPYGKVLIVDDMNTNLFVAQGLMKPYGLTIETAISGFEALDKIRAGDTYDIIFMDHMMPEMDGMETTQRIRETGYTRAIVALTANALIGQAEEFMKNGFDGFIAKPINIGQLNDSLNTLIRDKQTPEVLENARLEKERLDSEEEDAPIENAEADTDTDDDPLATLRKIDMLDVDPALDAMSGLPDLYIDTVKLTMRLLSERVEKMDKFLPTDIKAFTIEVHGLKSSMKNIGASKLGSQAAKLERNALDGNHDYCNENYPPFKEGLLTLESLLKAALGDDGAEEKETAEVSSLLPALEEAKTAAESYDRDTAMDIITKHAAFSYDEETDKTLQEVINALEVFDCTAAFDKLQELQDKIK
ncbi:MAG: ATP-binding protein [Defluviitaleaceae bacterium]|nr:ATP-binding protein [Defluviitaleaceae bacterium]MCL2261745.1 ATP-binding protein [Defluviitaleaceae bacterium]